MTHIVHLTASTFYGGPERQMLGLAKNLPPEVKTTFVSFPEGGRCRAFLATCRQEGFHTVALVNDSPRVFRTVAELAALLKSLKADVVFCHGYKANILGRPACRRIKLPAVAVSRGWTGESFKVRLYESLDRMHLRFMDHVIAVSNAQADKVKACGVKPEKLTTIRNAIDPERFVDCDDTYRERMQRFFREPKSLIIGAAGRLSPEKGFDVLLDAAVRVLERRPEVGFVIFGGGPLKTQLQHQLTMLGLNGAVVLGGFRNDLDRFVPALDLFVQSSYTEGLPNVVLEACAAGVPVVATAVGGTPEIIEDGVSGRLVPKGDPDALATAILESIECPEKMQDTGFNGRQQVLELFSFQTQVMDYLKFLRRYEKSPTTPGRPRHVAHTGEPTWDK